MATHLISLRNTALTFLGCLTLVSPLRAAELDSERLQKLEDAVRQLQTRNAELEREVHEMKAKHQPFAPIMSDSDKGSHAEYKSVTTAPAPPPVDVHPGGPEFKLTLGGYIQFNFEDGDVSAFEGRFGLTALKDRFRLRRARISLTGDFLEKFDFKIEGDFEQSDTAITALRSVNFTNRTTTTVTNNNRVDFSGTDIFINWHQFPEFQIRIGQWKAPFGLEQLTPDTLIYTIERSLPTGALTPERQIGAMVWGKPFATVMPDEKDLVTYYAGAFNGNGRNFNNNDNNEFMYVGRLELQPWKSKFLGDSFLKLGGDYLFSRDETGTNISPALNLRVGPDGSLSAYTLTSPDERNAWSVDGWLRLGPFDFIAEYLSEDIDARRIFSNVPPTFADINPHGWYVQGSYFLVPKKLQAVVKWEELSPDQRDDDGIHSITAGLNYYIHGDNIKLMGDYVHTWSDFREAHPQFGDDQFDEVLLRMQVIF